MDQQWPADKVERWPLAKLVPYARNARTHSPAQIAQLAASIRQWGWTNPILIDEDGEIIAGHGRVMAAETLGIDAVPVMVARGWPLDKKRAYGLADNQLALNAGWDEHLLAAELIEVGADLRGFVGFSVEQLREMSIGVDATAFPEIPEGERSEFRQMSFVLHKDQAEIVAAAIAASRGKGAFDGPNPNRNGNALSRICSSYLEWQTQAQKTSA